MTRASLVRSTILVALVFLFGCSSVQVPLESDYLRGSSQLYYSPDGTLFVIGRRSRYENHDFMEAEAAGQPLPRWREFLRLGEWEFRYPNGKAKARITYELAWYTDCCAGGLCKQPYEVRTGNFEAWWPDGRPLARGSFTFDWQPISTNCEGGDRIKKPKLGPDAHFWDQNGTPEDVSILRIAGVPLEEL